MADQTTTSPSNGQQKHHRGRPKKNLGEAPAAPQKKKKPSKYANGKAVKGPGKPSLYLEKKDLIIQVIAEGNYQVTAAQVAGVCPQTISEWKILHPEFAEAIKAAEAQAEREALSMVRAHSAANWQAAAWYLERKFPEKFGKVDRLQIDKIQKEIQEMTDDELIAYLRRTGNQGISPAE